MTPAKARHKLTVARHVLLSRLFTSKLPFHASNFSRGVNDSSQHIITLKAELHVTQGRSLASSRHRHRHRQNLSQKARIWQTSVIRTRWSVDTPKARIPSLQSLPLSSLFNTPPHPITTKKAQSTRRALHSHLIWKFYRGTATLCSSTVLHKFVLSSRQQHATF